MPRLKRLYTIAPFLLMGACMPAHLAKYRSQSLAPEAEGIQPQVKSAETPTPGGVSGDPIIHASAEATWQAVLDVLIENYNLNVVAKDSSVITTEWDSYILDNRVYRNKVSVRLSTSGWNRTAVNIHNSVETLSQESLGSVWMPAGNGMAERERILENIRLRLRGPTPSSMESDSEK